MIITCCCFSYTTAAIKPCEAVLAGLRGIRCASRYDCSSADLNPIGAISKNDLRRFLVWASQHLGYSELAHVEAAPPTAELEPIREGVAAQARLSLSTRA